MRRYELRVHRPIASTRAGGTRAAQPDDASRAAGLLCVRSDNVQ